jgi:hypothetical protein
MVIEQHREVTSYPFLLRSLAAHVSDARRRPRSRTFSLRNSKFCCRTCDSFHASQKLAPVSSIVTVPNSMVRL